VGARDGDVEAGGFEDFGGGFGGRVGPIILVGTGLPRLTGAGYNSSSAAFPTMTSPVTQNPGMPLTPSVTLSLKYSE